MELKKALVVGMARSGIAAAKLLVFRGATAVVNDTKAWEQFEGGLKELEVPGVEFRLGEDPVPILNEGVEAVILSPGVPVSAPVVRAAREKGIPVLHIGKAAAIWRPLPAPTAKPPPPPCFLKFSKTTASGYIPWATSAIPIPGKCRACGRRT